MANGIDGIDHAVVAVADLEIAKARYIRLGFTVTPRRRMVGWGTANYSVMFDDKDFIELLGVVDSSAFLTPGLADFLVGGEGAMAVTLRANDVTSAHAALSTLGANPTPLNEVTINCEAPWGDLPQSFRWLKIGEAATPDMYLMLVQPLTPQNMRRPEWVEHANGARSIRAMTIVVSDPRRPTPRLRAPIRRPSPRDYRRVRDIHGARRLSFHHPGGPGSALRRCRPSRRPSGPHHCGADPWDRRHGGCSTLF